MPHCPLRDMVKFRKSAVNAGSRDQQEDISSAYLVRRFSPYLSLRLEMAMTKSVGPRSEPCTILALMVQRGEIAEGKKLPHRGLGRSPRSRRNFEHLIPWQVECILGSCLPNNFQKLGDCPKLFESWETRPTGPIGWLRLCIWAIFKHLFKVRY